jgi:hypothetical protein
MAKNYKVVSYFLDRPDVVKIFDDLEAFHNFCRMELLEFNEAYLYNRSNDIWNKFYQSTKPPKRNNVKRERINR